MQKSARSLIRWQLAALGFLALVVIMRTLLDQLYPGTDARFVSVLVVFGSVILAFALGGLGGIAELYCMFEKEHETALGCIFLFFCAIPCCVVMASISKWNYEMFQVCFMAVGSAGIGNFLIIKAGGVKILRELVSSMMIFTVSYWLAIHDLISPTAFIMPPLAALFGGAALIAFLHFFAWSGRWKIVRQPDTD